MRLRSWFLTAFALAALGGLAGGAYWTRDDWQPWLAKLRPAPAASAEPADAHDDHTHGHVDRIKLSPQAQANLRLVVEPVVPETYWKTLQIPGIVVDRPGESDRGLTAPATGVVTEVKGRPGDTVQPGQPLFTLRLLSEPIHTAQAELFKTTRDLQLNAEQRELLKRSAGAVPEIRLIELDNQERRFKAAVAAYRQELLTRGLKPEQLDAAADGRFVTEITVAVPSRPTDAGQLVSNHSAGAQALNASQTGLAYEMKELKVQLGDQVQAGQALCLLANHQALLVEGRAFKQESALLERAAQAGWPVQAEFAEEANGWPALEGGLTIQYLANSVDAVSRTFGFYLPLANQSRSYARDGHTHLVWRYRPGQRVRLKVPVEQIEDVFVLPAEAVVRDGAEVYAFRQNGDFFERKPVRVVHQDRDSAVVANDGSIGAGQYVARNAAATLNRILKAQAAGGEGGHGGHEGHNH